MYGPPERPALTAARGAVMSQVSVDAVVTGRLMLPERYAFRTVGNPLTTIRGVCLAFVLRHPDAGTILVDTGFHQDAISDRRRDFGFPMNVMFLGLRPEPFERQLRDRGIEPAEVQTVLMTHLHVDHTSGMRLLGDGVLPKPEDLRC